MNRVFVDMDGVLADFDRLKLELECTGEDLKCRPGAFEQMQPIAGALAGVRSLIGMGYEVWIATKPPTGIPHAYADKAAWILRHLPELKRRIIMTHNKGLLGDCDDYLIDDRPHKAFCSDFKGRLIHFGGGCDWNAVLATFRTERHALGERDQTMGELRPFASTAFGTLTIEPIAGNCLLLTETYDRNEIALTFDEAIALRDILIDVTQPEVGPGE